MSAKSSLFEFDGALASAIFVVDVVRAAAGLALRTDPLPSPQDTITSAQMAIAATMLAPPETGRVGMDARSFVAVQ
jgi:hypothetical protein